MAAACSGAAIERQNHGTDYDGVWGPLITVQTGFALDQEVRFEGSSGGVISALSAHLIESGEVDFVVQTKASVEDPIGNTTVRSFSRRDVLAAAGSRYAPSSPLADLEQHLQTGLRFAFVGRPCDVAALRRLARVDPRIDNQVKLMLSFFCAGVPSRKGALSVLDALDVDHQDLESFSYRGRGWPGLTRAIRRDGSEVSMDYNSSWGTILNRHLQFRCKICPDGTGETADIVCADAWYGKDGYPDFTEAEGRSLVIARTAKGLHAVEQAEATGVLQLSDLDVNELPRMQPYQYERKRVALIRGLALFARRGVLPKFRGMQLFYLALRNSPVNSLRNFVGTFKRIPKKSFE